MSSKCEKTQKSGKEKKSCNSSQLKSSPHPFKRKTVTDAERVSEDIQRLQVYVKNLEYCPIEPPTYSDRTEQLAQPTVKNLRGTYDTFKHILPKHKTQMLKEDLDKLDSRNITTEQLKEYMQRWAEIEKERELAHRQRFEQFQRTLDLIERQCRQSVMKDLVQKFAEYVADRTVKSDYPKVVTEPHQRLCRGLVCNMLESLGIHVQQCKPVDAQLFEAIANVLADIILKTLYRVQVADPRQFELPDEVPEIKCTQIDCISKRARRAVQKCVTKRHAKIEEELLKFKSLVNDADLQYNLFMNSRKKCSGMT